MGLSLWLYVDVDTGSPEPQTHCCADDFSITHNVGGMWDKAGVYDALYRSNGRPASEVLEVLREGLANMEANPEEYAALNPGSGFGSYDGALTFLRRFTAACAEHPKALIGVAA